MGNGRNRQGRWHCAPQPRLLVTNRSPSASVATGLKSSHTKEEKDLLEMAFTVKQDKLKGE